MARKPRIHTIPHPDGGWATKKEGAERVGGRYRTKEEAQSAGRSQAIREKTEHVIHNRDGKISDSDSYGNDPNPPKDTVH